ncbi:MAG: phage major capsid protein [Desulfobacteraceae bacterium]|nr:phage major capsid protein [Desulfobacteraceae bacterium]
MEKEKIKLSDLDKRVEDTAKNAIQTLLEEQVNDRLKAQLAEMLPDALSQIVTVENPEEKAAKEEADKFESGEKFLKALVDFKLGKSADTRLQFVTKQGDIISKVAGHMEIGEDSQGGFLVPEVYRKQLYEIALEGMVVRPRGATVIPMSSDSVKIPYVNDTSHASTVFGGISATWTAEAAQKSATKPTFGQMELTPHKLAGITYASNELIDDSMFSLAALIKRMFGSAWGYFEDDAFLVGTGAGQPLGIQNCGCTINVLRHTANRVMIEDVSEMWMRLLPTSQRNAYWIANPTVIPQLLQMGSANAADASGKNLVYIDRVPDGPVWKIWGRPVIFSEKMQALGTQGDIGLYDFRYYLIGDRQPITIDASEHIRFDYDETAWRFVLRVAGQCWPQAAMTLRRGGITQSPFVQLDDDTS